LASSVRRLLLRLFVFRPAAVGARFARDPVALPLPLQLTLSLPLSLSLLCRSRSSLQEQKRFGLAAESLLFEWSKRSNQEKPTPRPRRPRIRRARVPAVLTKRRPLRNSHVHVLEHARFPLRFAPLLGAPEGPRVPSTRLPAWSSRRASDSTCSARVESEALAAEQAPLYGLAVIT